MDKTKPLNQIGVSKRCLNQARVSKRIVLAVLGGFAVYILLYKHATQTKTTADVLDKKIFRENQQPATQTTSNAKFSTRYRQETMTRLQRKRVMTFYSSSDHIFDKREDFNSFVDEFVGTLPPTEPTCRPIDVTRLRSAKVIQGYYKKSWNFTTSTLVGTPLWLEQNKKIVQAMQEGAKTIEDVKASLKRYNLFWYDFTRPSDDVTTLVLSSLRSAGESEVHVQTKLDKYYDCFASRNAKIKRRNDHEPMGRQIPALCVHHCNKNISELSKLTPTNGIPDHVLHKDFTAGIGCPGPNTNNADQLKWLAMYSLHNADTGDVMESIDIVPGGGAISHDGQIFLTNNRVLQIAHYFYGYHEEAKKAVNDALLIDVSP